MTSWVCWDRAGNVAPDELALHDLTLSAMRLVRHRVFGKECITKRIDGGHE
jgi:hypothetical protein